MSEVNGRRIYVHQDAFFAVAISGKRETYATSRALVGVRMAKIVHHHAIANGLELGAVRQEVADTLVLPIGGGRHRQITEFLQGLDYIPKLPWQVEKRLPVLRAEETVVDTCSQDGYYTFATGSAAADRMFEDRVPVPDLKQSISSGKGPNDLTIITRKGSLALVNQETLLASGASVGESPGYVHTIDKAMRLNYQWGLAALIQAINEDMGFTPDEVMVTDGLASAVDRTFAHSSY